MQYRACRELRRVYVSNLRARLIIAMNHRSRRLALLVALALVAQGCTARDVSNSAMQAEAGPSEAPAAVRPRPPVSASDEPTPLRPLAPTVHIGTGVVVGAAPAASVPSGATSVDQTGAVAFNFVNVDIRDIIREILGEQLHLGYVIDPKVQGTATVQTGAPLPREAVLPTLENVLRANGLALVNLNGIYRVLPIEDASRAAGTILSSPLRGNKPGFAIRVMPLKFSSAVDLQRVLDPYVPAGGGLQVDTTRNILIAAGTPQDLDSFAQLVAVFDADWLRGMSYAIYPLKVETAKNMLAELEDIFGEGGEGLLGSAMRIVPLDRLNAILVISPQPAYLKEAKDWIDRLDAGNDETTPRLFQYYVQNSRATDLAAVLNEVLASGGGGGGGARTAQTAPGSTAVSLGGSRGGSSFGGGAGGGAGGGGFGGGLSSSGTSSSGISGGAASGGASATGGAQPQPQPLSTSSSAASPARTTPPSAGRASNRVSLGGGGGTGGGGELETPVVRVVADDKNNALIIYAKPRDYRMIESTIKRLDIIPLQVLIEATIAEVTLDDQLKYGLQFFFKTGNGRSLVNLVGDPTISSAVGGFSYSILGANTNIVLNALSSVTDVRVVSSPQLLVLDHQTAVLQVGDQVPIPVQQSQSVVTPGAPVINTIEYRDTGVILTVSPRVNSSGLVTLDITQEVSDVGSTNPALQNAPTINQRRITTSVIVQDGATIALGGLITDNGNKGKSGIPLLSDIPVVGSLFGTRNSEKKRFELLVMLSPKVVRDPQEAHDRTEELRERLRALKPLDLKIR
jgi:general secretion pathway protein D